MNYVERLLERIEKSPLRYSTERFKAGDFVRGAGEDYDELLILKDGEVAIESVGRSGRILEVERIRAVDLVLPCITFSENPVLDVDIISKVDSTIISVDKEQFIDFIWKDRECAEEFFSYLGTQFSRIVKRLSEVAMNDLKEKIASYIIELHEEQKSEVVNVPVTREELARMLGATRPSISRILSSFVEQGLIEIKRNRLTIKDLASLKSLAGY